MIDPAIAYEGGAIEQRLMRIRLGLQAVNRLLASER